MIYPFCVSEETIKLLPIPPAHECLFFIIHQTDWGCLGVKSESFFWEKLCFRVLVHELLEN